MRTAGWLAVAVLAVVLLQCAVGVNGLREKIRNQMVDDVAISDISLLLPYSGKTRVTYELEAYNGCFKWYVICIFAAFPHFMLLFVEEAIRVDHSGW